MAHPHNLSYFYSRHMNSNSLMSNIGNKVKSAAELAGAVKGLYDVGKWIYTGARALGPIVASASMAL